jgi:hypothetical protein
MKMAGKLWHRVPDETGKAQLKEVDPSQLRIERPTVVYLSGFLTNNNRPEYVAGSIKRVEELLKTAPEGTVQPDIYAWSHKGLSNLFNLAIYDSLPNSRSSEAGYILGSSVLMPLVADGFKRLPDGSVEGTKISAEEATKRLRNVTFFGYSAGSIVAQETFNATMKMMKGVGYEETEARKLLKEVVLIAVGCISRPTKETDRYTTVCLVASNDRINRFKNMTWGPLGTLRRTFFSGYTIGKNSKDLSIRPLSDSSIFISAAVRPSLYEFKTDEQTGERQKKGFAPLYPSWTGRRSYHEMPHYVTVDDKNNPFARIALYALTNAVNRAGAPKALPLLNTPDGCPFGPEAAQAYGLRLEQAMKPMPQKLAKR